MQPPRCSLAGRGCATSPACCSSHAPCPGLPECKGARLSVWLAIRAQCTDALRRLPRARLANRSPPLVSLVSAGAVISGASVWKYLALGGSLCTDGSHGRERTMPPQGWPWIGSPSMTTGQKTRKKSTGDDRALLLDGLRRNAGYRPLYQSIANEIEAD